MWLLLNSFISTRSGLITIVALILVSGAFYGGATWQKNQCAAKFTEQREALFKQLQAEQTRANQAFLQYETEKANRTQAAQIMSKEVTRVIQKPVYRTCRLDADGMRLLESAIYQANLTTTCPILSKPSSPNMGDLLSFAIETTQQYGECAAKHRALAEWLDGFNQ